MLFMGYGGGGGSGAIDVDRVWTRLLHIIS